MSCTSCPFACTSASAVSSTENSALTVVTCSGGSNQQWVHTKDLQFKNVGSGKCAAYSSGNVVNKTCAAVAEQAWAFRG